MGFLYTPLPIWLSVCGWFAAVGLLALAVWKSPFKRLRDDTLQHLWLGMIVAISVMWAMDAWLDDGPVMHLLGATLMVTLFDWGLALLALASITGLVAVIFGAPWDGIGLTFVVLGAVPVFVSMFLQRAIAAWLPRHLLIFIFGHGFLTAAAALLAAAGSTVGIHMLLHRSGWDVIPEGYLLSAFLLASAEAWFSGMLTAIFAVYKPEWVTTYDQRLYHLDRGPRA
jgi:uncharacterized membrane protein